MTNQHSADGSTEVAELELEEILQHCHFIPIQDSPDSTSAVYDLNSNCNRVAGGFVSPAPAVSCPEGLWGKHVTFQYLRDWNAAGDYQTTLPSPTSLRSDRMSYNS
jgi:hypothetical protein